MWNFLKYWIWKQWNSNQDTKCCHCKVVFLSCPSFGLLHSAQIQIFFPMKEAIVTTPYSVFKHIIHLLRYFEILSLSKIENDVCKGIFKLVKSMLKKLKPIFCRKKSSLACTLVYIPCVWFVRSCLLNWTQKQGELFALVACCCFPLVAATILHYTTVPRY